MTKVYLVNVYLWDGSDWQELSWSCFSMNCWYHLPLKGNRSNYQALSNVLVLMLQALMSAFLQGTLELSVHNDMLILFNRKGRTRRALICSQFGHLHWNEWGRPACASSPVARERADTILQRFENSNDTILRCMSAATLVHSNHWVSGQKFKARRG